MKPRYPLKEFNYVKQFSCLADKCEDQCCSVWRVSVNEEIYEKYKQEAPSLAANVVEDETGKKFELNAVTRECNQLQDKLCTVCTNYGYEFLPNTCYFFPRTIRKVGENTLMVSATTSCPEITRLVLFGDNPFGITEGEENRLPEEIYDYKPYNVSEEAFFYVVKRFIAEAERQDLEIEAILLRMVIVSKMLDDFDITAWHGVVDSLFDVANYYFIPESETRLNQFDLLLCVSELKAKGVARFDAAYEAAQSIFITTVDRDTHRPNVAIAPWVFESYQGKTKADIDRVLKRFVASEIARNLFPYAGRDSALAYDEMVMIALSFALARLCLIGKIDMEGNAPSEDEVVRSIQGIFRSQNHLTRNKVEFYKEKGYTNFSVLAQIIYLR